MVLPGKMSIPAALMLSGALAVVIALAFYARGRAREWHLSHHFALMPAIILSFILVIGALADVVVDHLRPVASEATVRIASRWVYALAAASSGFLVITALVFLFVSRKKKEGHQRTSAILDAAIDGILTWDRHGHIESINPAGRRMFGLTDTQAPLASLSELIPGMANRSYEDIRERFETPPDDALTFSTETEGRRADGWLFPMEISVSETVLPSGETLFTGIMRDISERRRVESDLLHAMSERQKMESELNIAREIQLNMLPSGFLPFPERDDVDLFAYLKPAREVGGDFYDFFEFPDGRICLVVGDVSGKGIPSALFMTLAKTMVKSRALNDPDPGHIITAINNDLCKGNEANMFVTLFIAFLDPAHGTLRYSNAGHNPPYLIRDDGSLERLDKRHGPVVGALEQVPYGVDEMAIGEGDALVIYTDGVTEAISEEAGLFGEPRFREILESLRFETATNIVRTIAEEVEEFEGDAAQTDDITILSVRLAHEAEESRILALDFDRENRLEEIAHVNQAFSEIAGECGIGTDIIQKFNIAFDELLSNIIFHGLREGDSTEVRIRIEIVPTRVKVAIASHGVPFDPLAVPPPDVTESLEDREPGGLGIHIVRSLMDDMTYHRRQSQNVINLLKHIPQASPAIELKTGT